MCCSWGVQAALLGGVWPDGIVHVHAVLCAHCVFEAAVECGTSPTSTATTAHIGSWVNFHSLHIWKPFTVTKFFLPLHDHAPNCMITCSSGSQPSLH